MGGAGGIPKEGSNNGGGGYDPATGAPLTPSGSPQTIPTQANYYDAMKAYASPTYALTPQSGYTGLAQQLQSAFSLSPQAYAAPGRTSLLDMYASPWSSLYGGPATPTFAEVWNQPATMGTAPPPGTPGYIGPGNTNVPPPAPPAPPAPPPPGSSNPGNSVPGGSPTGPIPPGTNPPTGGVDSGRPPNSGGTKMGGGEFDQNRFNQANAWLAQQHAFDANLPTTGPEGRDLGSVLFPNGRPAGGHTRAPKGLLAGGYTGPGGMDMGSLLFPNGRPPRGGQRR